MNLAPLSERADEGVDPVRCKARQYTLEHGEFLEKHTKGLDLQTSEGDGVLYPQL